MPERLNPPCEPADELPRDQKVLFRFKTTEADKAHAHDDMAEEYVVFECPECDAGLIIYGYSHYQKKWIANWSGRHVVKRLLEIAKGKVKT